MPRREDHEVRQGHVGHWERGGGNYSSDFSGYKNYLVWIKTNKITALKQKCER